MDGLFGSGMKHSMQPEKDFKRKSKEQQAKEIYSNPSGWIWLGTAGYGWERPDTVGNEWNGWERMVTGGF